MQAAGCSTQLRAAPAGARLRAPRPRCSGAAASAGRVRVVRVSADESMSEAYARIRESRRRSKEKFERQEKLEKAGALGKLFSGVVGGALHRQRRTAPRCAALHGAVLRCAALRCAPYLRAGVQQRPHRAQCRTRRGAAGAALRRRFGASEARASEHALRTRCCAPHPRCAASRPGCCVRACVRACACARDAPRCRCCAQAAWNGRGARGTLVGLRPLRRPFADAHAPPIPPFDCTPALDFQEDIKSDRKALAAASKLRKGERMTDESAGALRRKVGGTKARRACAAPRGSAGAWPHALGCAVPLRACACACRTPSTRTRADACNLPRPFAPLPFFLSFAQSGFFGETVDAKGKYLEQGYVSTRPTEVPYVPVLIVIGALSRDANAEADADAFDAFDACVCVCVLMLTRLCVCAQCWALWRRPWRWWPRLAERAALRARMPALRTCPPPASLARPAALLQLRATRRARRRRRSAPAFVFHCCFTFPFTTSSTRHRRRPHS
jgi:hypothetical protein